MVVNKETKAGEGNLKVDKHMIEWQANTHFIIMSVE